MFLFAALALIEVHSVPYNGLFQYDYKTEVAQKVDERTHLVCTSRVRRSVGTCTPDIAFSSPW